MLQKLKNTSKKYLTIKSIAKYIAKILLVVSIIIGIKLRYNNPISYQSDYTRA